MSVGQLISQISEDIDSIELVHKLLGEKTLAKLEGFKKEVMDEMCNINEAAGAMTRKHFEHLAGKTAGLKDTDVELHDAAKDIGHKIGHASNPQFSSAHYEKAANGEGRNNRSSGEVKYTGTHKKAAAALIDASSHPEHIKNKLHGFFSGAMA